MVRVDVGIRDGGDDGLARALATDEIGVLGQRGISDLPRAT